MTKKYLSASIFLAVAIFLLVPGLKAQVSTTGSIAGYVTDDTKTGLPGVSVTATSPTMVGSRQAVSDANGYYRLPALPAGKYKIAVSLTGFMPVTQINIEVNISAMLNLNFIMTPKTLYENEVVVTAPAPLVEPEKTTMDTVIDSSILNSMPILGRDFMQSIKILPGVTDSAFGVTISGGRDTDKNYNIDGTDNVDIVQGKITMGGGYDITVNKPFMNFDQEAIQELSVGRGAYSADIGFGSGGLINVVTKSGSNVFHGSFYFSLRNSHLDENVPYPFQQYYFGGSLGGALIKDKLFFFTTISPGYQRKGYDTRSAYYYYLPADLMSTTKELSTFFKLTWQLNKSNNLNISVNVPLSRYDSQDYFLHIAPFPEYARKNSGVSLTLTETATLSPNLLVESVLSAGRTVDKTVNLSNAHLGFVEDEEIYPAPGSITGTSNVDDRFLRTKFNWSEKMTLFVDDWGGRHTIASGVEVRYNGSDQSYSYREDIQLYPLIPYQLDWGYPAQMITVSDPFEQKFHQTYIAGYVADSWAPIKRLTLKPGVRVSRNSFMPKVLVEPRFDFAFDLFGDAKTVIRGGANLYYERLNSYVQQLVNHPLLRSIEIYGDGSIIESGQNYKNYVLDPSLTYPKTKELTFGVERELVRDLALSVDFVYRKYEDQLYRRWINLRDPVTGQRDDPTKDALVLMGSSGRSKYMGLHFILQKRYSHGYQFLLSYSCQTSKGNSIFFGDFSQLNYVYRGVFLTKGQPQLADLTGKTAFDKPYDFKAYGSVALPLKINLSAVFNYTAGTPYTTYDYLQSIITRKPVLVSSYQGLRSQPTLNLNVRLEKEFLIGASKLRIMADAFNLTNKVNVFSTVDDVSGLVGAFGDPYQIGEPRVIQLGARFEF